MSRLAPIVVLGLSVVLGACVHHHHHRPARRSLPPAAIHKPGPPPQAPAHGYRHRHHAHGVDLVFDAALGLYLVAEHADHFFRDGHFYRWDGKAWLVSPHLGRGWVVVKLDRLPKALRKHRRRHRHLRRHH